MGSTNHGTQINNFGYFVEAESSTFNRILKDVLSPGIYSGGWLTKVSNTEVTLSPFSIQIADGTYQISSVSTSTATLNSTTLDSGSISSSTPVLVFRWAFQEAAINYVEIRAIASVASKQSNDIVIGSCTFEGSTLTGFSYVSRGQAKLQDFFLRPEATDATELYIRVLGGRATFGDSTYTINAQKVGPFTVPGSPNSRIDLVYVDTDGSLQIAQGSAGTSPSAPDYGNKLVLAEVTVVNGVTNITASNINDVRSFLISYQDVVTVITQGTRTNLDSVGNEIVQGSVYRASVDGTVYGYGTTHASNTAICQVGSSNPPNMTIQAHRNTTLLLNPGIHSFSFRINKDEYFKVSGYQSGVSIYYHPNTDPGQVVKQ